MDHSFDKPYWDELWQDGHGEGDRPGAAAAMSVAPPNPHLLTEVRGLAPGTALEAGCGAGAEAIWLAEQGWHVTAVDISAQALARAAERAEASSAGDRLTWVEADLSAWEPDAQHDLVTTHYAHPSIPQLEFYERIAGWVAPGGTLLIVGHLGGHDAGHGHGDHGAGHGRGHGDHDVVPPEKASVTAAAITERLDPERWEVVTAEESERTVRGPQDREVTLHDVVVRATRIG